MKPTIAPSETLEAHPEAHGEYAVASAAASLICVGLKA
jgi:hypothetical protein